jgi:hypothetical protein
VIASYFVRRALAAAPSDGLGKDGTNGLPGGGGASGGADETLAAAFGARAPRYDTSDVATGEPACSESGPTVTTGDGGTMRALAVCTARLRPDKSVDPSVLADLRALAAIGFDIYADAQLVRAAAPPAVARIATAWPGAVVAPAGMDLVMRGTR